jgi:hypothetical protein
LSSSITKILTLKKGIGPLEAGMARETREGEAVGVILYFCQGRSYARANCC